MSTSTQATESATARAVEYTRRGGPDGLQLVDRPVREPGPGEVRVQIHPRRVNPTDWTSCQDDGQGGRLTHRRSPARTGAGVVDAVGVGVEPALHGLRVWVWEAAR